MTSEFSLLACLRQDLISTFAVCLRHTYNLQKKFIKENYMQTVE